jgi:uncharacterized protein (TIGR03067 family)
MDDKELLQGEWTMISMETKSVKSSDDDVKPYRLKIDGDKWVVTKRGHNAFNAVMKIDQSVMPKNVDLVYPAGTGEAISQGIYEIDGDTLTMCRSGGYKDRPKEFKTTLEAYILVVWKRVPK